MQLVVYRAVDRSLGSIRMHLFSLRLSFRVLRSTRVVSEYYLLGNTAEGHDEAVKEVLQKPARQHADPITGTCYAIITPQIRCEWRSGWSRPKIWSCQRLRNTLSPAPDAATWPALLEAERLTSGCTIVSY